MWAGRTGGCPLKTLLDYKETPKFQPYPTPEAGETVAGDRGQPEPNPHLPRPRSGTCFAPGRIPRVSPGHRSPAHGGTGHPRTARTRADGNPRRRAGLGHAWPEEKHRASRAGAQTRRAGVVIAGTRVGSRVRIWGAPAKSGPLVPGGPVDAPATVVPPRVSPGQARGGHSTGLPPSWVCPHSSHGAAVSRGSPATAPPA